MRVLCVVLKFQVLMIPTLLSYIAFNIFTTSRWYADQARSGKIFLAMKPFLFEPSRRVLYTQVKVKRKGHSH